MRGWNERRAFSPQHLYLGRAVRHMRAKQGTSRQQLARACAMRRGDLARLERGRYDPDAVLLMRLARGLDACLTMLGLQIDNAAVIAEIERRRPRRERARRRLAALARR